MSMQTLLSITHGESLVPQFEYRTIDERADKSRVGTGHSCFRTPYGETDKTCQYPFDITCIGNSRNIAIFRAFESRPLWEWRYYDAGPDATEKVSFAVNDTWRAWTVLRGGKMKPSRFGSDHRFRR
jgi:hypothetical protein